MVSAWRNFKNIFSRPFFTIIFRPEMLIFHPYSILTGDTMVGFVLISVNNFIKGSFLYYVRVKGWVGSIAKYLLFLTGVGG